MKQGGKAGLWSRALVLSPIKIRLTAKEAALVSFILSESRRKSLAGDAAEARAALNNVAVAIAAVAAYNCVGLFDIVSTIAAIELGVAEEANPFMRAVMDNYGPGWIAAKLFLQLVISAMVLWFPHRIVLAMFITAVSLNAFIVLNNVRIALGF